MGNREFLKQLLLTNINLSICKIKAKRKIFTCAAMLGIVDEILQLPLLYAFFTGSAGKDQIYSLPKQNRRLLRAIPLRFSGPCVLWPYSSACRGW